jgi:hypothetical protein
MGVTSRRSTRRWVGALAVLVLASSATACGGDDSGAADFTIVPDGAGTAAAPPAAPATTASVTTTPETTPTTTNPATTTQFTVTGDTKVMWGLSEMGQASSEPSAFPLEVSDDHRYLEDQNGRPWRVQADAAWLMSSEATPEQVDQYLDTRKAQGFNSFYLMAAVHPGGYGAAKHAPNNQAGDPPFATPGDFSTAGATPASERYWKWIDSIVDKAAQRNMVVMLAYNYLGWSGGDMGWYADINAMPSMQSLHAWGEWIGRRYKDKPNIIWFGLGDFAPPPGTDGSKRVVEIAKGIKDAGATQLVMAEPNPPDEIPGEHPDFGPLADMNSFYGYGPDGVGTTYETSKRAWNDTPTKPAWMQEGTYEFENNWGHYSGKPWDTRRGRFWSVLAGGTAGDGFGTRDVWQWQDIPDSLHTPGAEQSSYAFALFGSMPWWELRPSGKDPGAAGRDLVTEGAGTWGQLDYITSAITAHGDWLLAYVPVLEQGQRTFSVDMSSLTGPVRARWFDPTTGNFIAIASDLANTGSHSFTTPGKRDDGTDDWLLVLDTGASGACGSISTTGTYTPPSTTIAGVRCEITASKVGEPGVIATAVAPSTAG